MVREDTVLQNFPLSCPKCKQQILVDAGKLHIYKLCIDGISEWKITIQLEQDNILKPAENPLYPG